MILYFADPDLNILGIASTDLSGTYVVIDDNKKEDVDTGVSTFEGKIIFENKDRKAIEQIVSAGNVILRYCPEEIKPASEASDAQSSTPEYTHNKFVINGFTDVFTIIESEIDTKYQTVYFYGEDGGLNLINNLVGTYSNENKDISTYVRATLYGTSFSLKNEIEDPDNKQLSLEWNSEQTIIERLQDIAAYFEFEFYFGFDILGMEIVNRWVTFVKERGRDTNQSVSINRRVDEIIIKKSIANLATALLPTGSDNLTLNGFNWDDGKGDFHTSGVYLMSEKARLKWGGATGHIYRTFSCDATTQLDLKNEALKELKKRIEPEVNYDVDVSDLPPGIGIGDRINVIDDNAELYVSGRILRITTSITQSIRQITLGEWRIKTSGLSSKVLELATSFKTISDEFGRFFIYSIQITSSGGNIFVDTLVETVLTAHVYSNGEEVPAAEIQNIGVIKWYDRRDMTTALGTGITYTITESDNIDSINIMARLEEE